VKFQQGHLYHIFNQGNNRQKISLFKDNYLFCLKKIKEYLSPYSDVLAWCLMPNHFLIMVYVKDTHLAIHGVARSHPVNTLKTRSLNESIGIMLRSYTIAFNKMHGFTGNLFREGTKAVCLNCPNDVTPSFLSRDGVTFFQRPDEYPPYHQTCFNYIHLNPVKARLVEHAVEWEYSSSRDYTGTRSGNLVNKESAKEFGLQFTEAVSKFNFLPLRHKDTKIQKM